MSFCPQGHLYCGPRRCAAIDAMSAEQSSFFGSVRRFERPGPGYAQVPLFFESLSCLAAVFTASRQRILELLPNRRMRPVEVMPGRCLLTIAGLQYRASDLGAYNELALAVPIAYGAHPLPVLDALRHGLARAFNAYVWQLPVTTEQSRDAGVALAGFPKSVADVRFEVDDARARCTLFEDGAGSIGLSCDPGAAAGERQLKARAWTTMGETPLVSTFVVRQTRYRDHYKRDAMQLELGQGPLAQAVRRLEPSDRPIASHWCKEGQAMLFGPRNPIDD